MAHGNLFNTNDNVATITNLTHGVPGQTITIISTRDVTYDVTNTNLKAGTVDIPTSEGDVTVWTCDGTNWYLVQFMDQSESSLSSAFDIDTLERLRCQSCIKWKLMKLFTK